MVTLLIWKKSSARLKCSLNYLESLRASGIAVLTPEYKIADWTHDKSNLYVVVDKIENATQFDDALESGDVDKAQAYDKLAKKLIGLVVAACESGGWICPESCRLDQYLIDNSQPAHSSPVFVDVDPERIAYIDPIAVVSFLIMSVAAWTLR